jgi:YebC/PmpR family DNA-binding regulatory protein
MSGHSKWSTIKRQKGVKDAAKGAIFTRLGNAIAIAAKNGTDPETNFELRLAIDKAKAANMPQENIKRSIDRIKNKESTNLQEVYYEGYGPGGVAIIVQVMTDNINRTYPEVRLAFSKHAGNIAEKGSVQYLFNFRGIITVNGKNEQNLLTCLDSGALDVIEENDDRLVVISGSSDLAKIRDNLRANKLEVIEAELGYLPINTIKISDQETADKIIRLLNALDDIDEVTNIFTNFEIADNLLKGN